jgi:DNA-binding LacI/PurR family transcriptional regulator
VLNVTLKEIAERAGVSISTVSRIINSTDGLFARKQVRDRVWEIIRDTGYVPNQSARELKLGENKMTSKQTNTLTCVLGRTRNAEENPFFAQVARAVEQQALAMGYAVINMYSAFDVENRALLQKIESAKTDGTIILGRFDSSMLKFFKTHHKNILYVGRNTIDAPWDQVICDGYEATKTALAHLFSLGHTRIGYIGENENEIRYAAYCDFVRDNGLDRDENLIAVSEQNGAGGYKGACFLLERAKPLPTAVFCAVDAAAIAAMKRFSEAGIAVPGTMSVIGIDDIEISSYVSPMLTTVSIPKAELGNIAVRTLIDRINKVHKLPMRIYIPHRLIIRESTAVGSIIDQGSYI